MDGDQNSSTLLLNSPENGANKLENRRGRPKAAMINSLIIEGASSHSGIRCEICSRVFPRDKSLQAHRRVHTGERPYVCDYPGCLRRFKQSGQLKTHQRLHTGERPFLCSAQGCSQRFTHANRHCPKHPSAPLTRCDDFTPADPLSPNQSYEVRQWLSRYMTERKEPKSEKKEKRAGHHSGGGTRRKLDPAQGASDIDAPADSSQPAFDLDESFTELNGSTAAPADSTHVTSSDSFEPDQGADYHELCQRSEPTRQVNECYWSVDSTRGAVESCRPISEAEETESHWTSLAVDSTPDSLESCRTTSEAETKPQWTSLVVDSSPDSVESCRTTSKADVTQAHWSTPAVDSTPEPCQTRVDSTCFTECPYPVSRLITNELSDMTNLSDCRARSHKSPRRLLRSPRASARLRSPILGGVGLRSPVRALLRSPLRSPRKPSSPMKAALLLLEGGAAAPRGRPVKNLFSGPQQEGGGSPRKRELPKKRWLRKARFEQEASCLANQIRPTVLRLSKSPLDSPAPLARPLADLATPPYSSEKPPPLAWATRTRPMPPAHGSNLRALLTPPPSRHVTLRSQVHHPFLTPPYPASMEDETDHTPAIEVAQTPDYGTPAPDYGAVPPSETATSEEEPLAIPLPPFESGDHGHPYAFPVLL